MIFDEECLRSRYGTLTFEEEKERERDGENLSWRREGKEGNEKEMERWNSLEGRWVLFLDFGFRLID